MRILFCNYEYPPLGGGGGVINAWLAEELAGRHEVTVLTSRAFDLPAESVENGVRVVRTPVFFRRQWASANLPSMLAYVLMGRSRGKRLVRREPFDVVNTHFVLPTGPVGRLVASVAGVPNVLSVHGGDLFDPSKFLSPHRHAVLRRTVRRLSSAADAVVAQSRNTLSNLHEYFAPQVAGSIIPLGIPRPPPVSASREQHGFNERDILWICVGRLVARKAIDQLIDTVADLGNPRIKLVVVGSGPLGGALRAQAQARGVADQVRFMDHVDETRKFELLSVADLFVSTSQHEGFGLVYLEAMAVGKPIVCYDAGGQTDFLTDTETGYVVGLNDRAGFTDRCRSLNDSAELRARIGAENRRRVEQFFVDRCAEQYESLFESLVKPVGHGVAARAAAERGTRTGVSGPGS